MIGIETGYDSVRSATMPPLRRSGVALGLGKGQLSLVGVALGILVIGNLAGGLPGVLKASLLWLPLMVLAAGRWKGRSFTERIGIEALFAFRKAAGKTVATVDVDAHRTESRLEIPGAIGERMHVLELVGTHVQGASFVWDAAAGTATAVLRFTSNAWDLTTSSEKDSRAQAFGRACASVAAMAGVARVVTYSRTIPRPTQFLRTDPARSLSPESTFEYDTLLGGAALGGAPYRDVLVTITVDRDAVKNEIKAAGGGRLGISTVLSARVNELVAALRGTGVSARSAAWLDGATIRGACRLAFDPTAAAWLDPRDGIPAHNVAVTSLAEHRTHLEVDSAVARTWWVERWPNEEIEAGFLSSLIASSDHWHTVTQVWVPADLAASEKRLNNDESALATLQRINKTLGRDQSTGQDREQASLAQRRADLTSGYGDVRYSVYVTAIAPEVSDLDAIGRWMMAAVPGTGLNPLRAQQWAAFTQAALPLGIPSRNG